ncbi:MAG: 16S rRNA (guanine(966)-N(2))-methyltransferase RsmD [Clostridium sp.]|nr:16S rRNA (guanine(966)-N(2))-methyltransferase RsmD [Clostridium sp.]
MEEHDILRVISGTARGHKLKTIKGNNTRPTSDRVKESLFSIIAGIIPNSNVLDLYAGTGSIGIEALSRGARLAYFVDKSRGCYALIKDNLENTKLVDRGYVVLADVFSALNRLGRDGNRFDIIFVDPPYGQGLIEETLKYIENNDIIGSRGIIIAEHDINDNIPAIIGGLKRYRQQKYGDTVMSFFKA